MFNALLTITVGSHFFKINRISPIAKPTIVEFAKRFIKYGIVRSNRGGFKRKPEAVFAAATKDRDEYRFHINQLPEFKLALANRNLTKQVEWKTLEVPEGETLPMNLRDGWVAKPKQIPFINHLITIKEDAPPGAAERPMRFIGAQPGFGKGQPLDAMVRGLYGWIRMGDIQVNDWVMSQDGYGTRVTGVYPQGLKPCYRLETEDYRKTECDDSHLWKVYEDPLKSDHEVIETKVLVERMYAGKVYHIDLPEPVEGISNDLPMDPYTLGFTYSTKLHDIPQDYFDATIEHRSQLLRGILDARAFIDPERLGASIVVHLTSTRDTYILIDLVRSLGEIALRWDRLSTVSVVLKVPEKWFRTRAKLEAAGNIKVRSHNKIKIESLTRIEDKETQCISVAHKSKLYITDDYIVTHNTFSSLNALAELAKRFVVFIRPMYIPQWEEAIVQTLNIRKDQVLVVQGGKQLLALLDLAERGQLGDVAAIIISNKTFQFWLKAYSKFGVDSTNLGYSFLPDEFYDRCKIGVRLSDEVHLDLHLQFLIDLYTNVKRSIGLSASLLSMDSFTTRMQELIYPHDIRHNGGPLNKYVSSIAAFYQIKDTRPTRTTYPGSTMYSHIAFEESIMQNNRLMDGYVKVIEQLFIEHFLKDYKPGQRCLIFAASVSLCTKLQYIFQRKYPHLKVNRYVDEDPFEYLLGADVCFSTVLSAGTAVDISMLKTVIMSNSLDSIQSNIQAFGRLREIAGLVLRFVYLVCLDIPKQVEYHKTKKELLIQRSKSYGEFFLPHSIG
jgi:hypothetical protein